MAEHDGIIAVFVFLILVAAARVAMGVLGALFDRPIPDLGLCPGWRSQHPASNAAMKSILFILVTPKILATMTLILSATLRVGIQKIPSGCASGCPRYRRAPRVRGRGNSRRLRPYGPFAQRSLS